MGRVTFILRMMLEKASLQAPKIEIQENAIG
jgi:hypothetical protein